MGGVVSNTGTWMQRVAQDWLVLQLHPALRARQHRAGHHHRAAVPADPAALAVRRPDRRPHAQAPAAPADPGLDGHHRRSRLGLLVRSPGSSSSGWSTCSRFVLGTGAAFDAPARQTFVSEMVGPDDLSNAVGLNSASFNLARLVGPALAGCLIAASAPGSSHRLGDPAQRRQLPRRDRRAAADAALRSCTPVERPPRTKGMIRDGVRYVRDRPGPDDGPHRWLLRRHLRAELPDDLGPDGDAGLPQGRRASTACSARSWRSAR